MALPQLILNAKQVAKVCNTQINDYFSPLNANPSRKIYGSLEKAHNVIKKETIILSIL
jgi:hypothetical protein